MSNYRKEFLTQVMYLDNFTCVYCGKRSHDLTIDHYIPQVLGGPDVLQNLVACCKWCNSSKNGRAPYEWGRMAKYGRFGKVKKRFVWPSIRPKTEIGLGAIAFESFSTVIFALVFINNFWHGSPDQFTPALEFARATAITYLTT